MQKTLTDNLIKSTKPTGKLFNVWDREVNGLFLEVKANGNKYYKAKHLSGPLRNRQKSLGAVTTLPLTEARKLAREFLGQEKQVELSPEEKRQQRIANRTLQDAVDDYIAKLCAEYNIDASDPYTHWRPTTVNWKRNILGKMAERMGNPKLSELNYYHFEQYKHYMCVELGKGVTFNRNLATFRPLIQREIALGNLDRDPSVAIKGTPEKQKNFSLNSDEFAEVQRVLNQVIEEGYQVTLPNGKSVKFRSPSAVDCIKLISVFGQRPVETAILQWSPTTVGNYVDFDNKRLVFYATKAHKWLEVQDEPETVAMSELVEAYLRALKDRSGTDFLFPKSSKNEPISYSCLYKTFNQLREIMNFKNEARKRKFTIYGFRHTYATRAVANGWDLIEVALQLKHKNLQTTKKYINPNSEIMSRIAKKADGLFDRSQF